MLHGSNFVGVGIADAVGDAAGEGVGVGVGVGLATGAGFLTATPLFHTNFLPDTMQVYSFPALVAVAFFFVQGVPAFGAAALTGVARLMSKTAPIATAPHLRMYVG